MDTDWRKQLEEFRAAGYTAVDKSLEPFERLMTAIEQERTEEQEHSNVHSDYIEIEGTKWLKENMTHEGRTHFQFDEAQEIAKSKGLRLPTKDEFRKLCAVGSTWDNKRKGRWFGYDHELKGKSKRSIFLPADGYMDYDVSTDNDGNKVRTLNGKLGYQGTSGYCWSSSAQSASNSYHLAFYSGAASYPTYSNRANGFTVRCVAE